MCDTNAPVPPASPHVLIVSDDALLRELVADLLRNERFEVSEAGDPVEAARCACDRAPSVVLLDAIVDGAIARPVLEAPEAVFGAELPTLVVLVGAGTPPEVRHHQLVDGVLPLPLTAELLVGAIRHHATWHSRRHVQSGTHLRPDVAVEVDHRTKKAQ